VGVEAHCERISMNACMARGNVLCVKMETTPSEFAFCSTIFCLTSLSVCMCVCACVFCVCMYDVHTYMCLSSLSSLNENHCESKFLVSTKFSWHPFTFSSYMDLIKDESFQDYTKTMSLPKETVY